VPEGQNGVLLEAFRHNAWATRQLLAFCQKLSKEQLTAPATGTYGDILTTFNHLIGAEARYLRAPAGTTPPWALNHEDTEDLDQLDARVEETEQLWERFLSSPVDGERVLAVDDGANEVRAAVILAQALHHGNAHREQICSILTGLGMEPPDLQVWEYAWAAGRLWERSMEGER
jgi:uncharacterized damage-inducible protein DinB